LVRGNLTQQLLFLPDVRVMPGLQHMLLHFSCNRVAPICLMQGRHMHALDEEAGVAREASGGVQLAGLRPEPAGSSSGHTQQQVRS
jgi:hypothetical protein